MALSEKNVGYPNFLNSDIKNQGYGLDTSIKMDKKPLL